MTTTKFYTDKADTLDLRGLDIGSNFWTFDMLEGVDTIVIDATSRGRADIYGAERLEADFSTMADDITVVVAPNIISWSQADNELRLSFAWSNLTSTMNVVGGNGDDGLKGAGGDDTLTGGDGDDWLSGGGGNDVLNGGIGNDELDGGTGINTLDGGVGDDQITGQIGDTLIGGAGADKLTLDLSALNGPIEFVAGNNTPFAADAASGFTSVSGFEAYDVVLTDADDTLDFRGYAGQLYLEYQSTFIMNQGTDTILLDAVSQGRAEAHDAERLEADFSGLIQDLNITSQRIYWFQDNYTYLDFKFQSELPTFMDVTGGSGNDRISGTAGNDEINGGSGDDTLSGSDGEDYLDGGDGADELFGGAGADELIGGTGNDKLYVMGNDTLLQGDAGYDQVIVLDAGGVNIAIGTGVEYAAGNSGNDIISGSGLLTAVTIGGAGGIDILTGGNAGDTLAGGEGNDILIGNGGDDMFFGGTGTDAFYGGAGDDRFYILGNDTTINGGGDYDRAIVLDTNGVNITLGFGTEYAAGNTGNDTISAAGLTTAVTIGGAGGNDTLTGGDAGDTLSGQFGNDTLFGGAGVDTLLGGVGDDHLYGGTGNDTLQGGVGADILFFEDNSGNDFVFGFENGQDRFSFAGHSQVNSMSDITITDSGADAFITLNGGGQIIVFGAAGQIDSGDFLFN